MEPEGEIPIRNLHFPACNDIVSQITFMELKPMKKMIFSALCTLSALLLPSCDTLKTLENMQSSEFLNPSVFETTPDYVLSIHEVVRYPRSEELEQEVTTFDGKRIYINTNSMIHSRNISKIEITLNKKDPQFCDLKLTLDRRGKMLWGNLATMFKGRDVALMVDGILYRVFKPAQLGEEAEAVIITGPFDRNTALNIAKNSEKNYGIFNPK